MRLFQRLVQVPSFLQAQALGLLETAVVRDTAAAHTEHDQTALQRQIDATDRQIDGLVYELYGLTEEEIEILEGKSNVK